MVDKVTLGQVFSEYFDFPCQFSFHRLLNDHHLSSGPGTIGQTVAAVPSGLNLSPGEREKNCCSDNVTSNREMNFMKVNCKGFDSCFFRGNGLEHVAGQLLS
jgi:hypothetical protein